MNSKRVWISVIMSTSFILVSTFSGISTASAAQSSSTGSSAASQISQSNKTALTSSTTLTPSSSSTPASSAITLAAMSPAGCYGQTDWAHVEFSTASVHGRTNCDFIVQEVGVTTTLQKKSWLWWNNLATDSSMRNLRTTSYDATPHWVCTGAGTQTYKGVSSHYSIEAGVTYTASTTGDAQTDVC